MCGECGKKQDVSLLLMVLKRKDSTRRLKRISSSTTNDYRTCVSISCLKLCWSNGKRNKCNRRWSSTRQRLEDNIKDRDFTDALVERGKKALYENGLLNGDIKYFNSVLKEYKIACPDKTSDYLMIERWLWWHASHSFVTCFEGT